MVVKRGELLGCALLFWAAAGLMALFLLCNPQAAILQDQWGHIRLWGLVLEVASLGISLSRRSLAGWLLPLTILPLLALPPTAARRVCPASAVGSIATAILALGRRPSLAKLCHRPWRGQRDWRRPRRRTGILFQMRRPAPSGKEARRNDPNEKGGDRD
jgi:hypothetical protein